MRTFIMAFCLFLFTTFTLPAQDITTNVVEFAWLPDGSGLLTTIIRFDRAKRQFLGSGIFKWDAKTGGVSLLIKNAVGASFSPDGTKLAFTKRTGDPRSADIYLYDFASQVETPLLTDTLREDHASWSPSGDKIVFTLSHSNFRSELKMYVYNFITKEKRQISPLNGHLHFNPKWSPHGNAIVYYLEKGDQHDQIYLTDENGSFHTNLTDNSETHNYYPSWLGGDIVYTQHPDQIIIMNLKTKQKKVVEGLKAYLASYDAKAERIAYLTPGSMENPSKLMIFDVKTKVSTATITREQLNALKLE